MAKVAWRPSSRAEIAGRAMGEALGVAVNLFYQNDTARNFMLGLKKAVDKEWAVRKNLGSSKGGRKT